MTWISPPAVCGRLVVRHEGAVVAAGPVLEVLTPDLLRDVFGVRGDTQRHADGVVRVTYAARPLAHDRETGPAAPLPRGAARRARGVSP